MRQIRGQLPVQKETAWERCEEESKALSACHHREGMQLPWKTPTGGPNMQRMPRLTSTVFTETEWEIFGLARVSLKSRVNSNYVPRTRPELRSWRRFWALRGGCFACILFVGNCRNPHHRDSAILNYFTSCLHTLAPTLFQQTLQNTQEIAWITECSLWSGRQVSPWFHKTGCLDWSTAYTYCHEVGTNLSWELWDFIA